MPAASSLTWGSTSATLNIGDIISVSYTNDLGASPNKAGIEYHLNGIATANVVAGSSLVEFTGATVGSVTIPADVDIGNGVITSNTLTLTVTAPADDEEYLNKRGLTHFWGNIDTLKQDKLTAGTNITIAADNTISATVPTNTDILNLVYPVGSIFMSATLSTAAAVGAAIGGTWVAWGAGRVPVGVDTADTDFDAAEETGGAKTVTLTEAQMPKHRHTGLMTHDGVTIGTTGSPSSSSSYFVIQKGNFTHGSVRTEYTGSGDPHSNLQPYITCYMYKRTA